MVAEDRACDESPKGWPEWMLPKLSSQASSRRYARN
jgi:hypothetical protein